MGEMDVADLAAEVDALRVLVGRLILLSGVDHPETFPFLASSLVDHELPGADAERRRRAHARLEALISVHRDAERANPPLPTSGH